MRLLTEIFDSRVKIFPDSNEASQDLNGRFILSNEPFSFQIAFKSDESVLPVYMEISANTPEQLFTVYCERYVPVLNASFNEYDNGFARKEPGLYPDVLEKRNTSGIVKDEGFWTHRWFEIGQKYLLNAVPRCWQSLFITVNENGIPLEEKELFITVRFFSQCDRTEVASRSFSLKVVNQLLPEQNTYYTNWFHYDCLSDTYNEKVFSDRYFEILKLYLKNAVKFGMNTLLTPAFTPPLDTSVGAQRKTVQLVKVTEEKTGYSFDFSTMKKFIETASCCGIKYFEHSHLFTQWGALHAPKIVAQTENGEREIFGWQTDSAGGEYITFLKLYLKSLREFLSDNGLLDRFLIHISDEPSQPQMLDKYTELYRLLSDELDRFTCIDAISDYEHYSRNKKVLPIVSIDSVGMFYKKCDNFWIYYTGETCKNNYPNRLITNTNARCRIIGLIMYYYSAMGFLNWGYNYYYDTLSHGFFNPCLNTGGYSMHPGTSYIVYPSADMQPLPSIREKVMMEAMCDVRALRLLERFIGRQKVLEMCNSFIGGISINMPDEKAEKIYGLRNIINRRIYEESEKDR